MQNIYILRHFKVEDCTKQSLNSEEFNKWVALYDDTALRYLDIKVPNVNKVYVSSQKRAIKTADYLKLNYEKTKLLQEVEANAFISTKLKFPKSFWLFIDRFLWFFNLKKSGENKRDTLQRIDKFIDKIKHQEEDILLISHGFFIKFLIKRLENMGYRGSKNFNIENAKIYHLKKKISL